MDNMESVRSEVRLSISLMVLSWELFLTLPYGMFVGLRALF